MDPLQALVTAGGGAVAIWVLKQFIDGKIHSSSEVGVYQQRIDNLTLEVKLLTKALNTANQQSSTILSLYKALQDREGEA
jgi:hypothetical protein